MAADRIANAVEALARADQRIVDAQEARQGAQAELDRAFAEVGWRRLTGLFSDDIGYYENPLFPGSTLKQADVLGAIEAQKALLA